MCSVKLNRLFYLILLTLIWVPLAWAVSLPFQDDMESGTGSWTAEAPWSLSQDTAHSTASAWSDSVGGYYANNMDVSLSLASSLDFSGAISPQMVFRHKYQLEPDFDFGYVEISTDSGADWAIIASFTGIQDEDWTLSQLDLSGYAGQADLLVRFRLVTDKTEVMDGWHIDDVAVAEAPQAVVLSEISNASYNSLGLSWTRSLDENFAYYEVYRATAPGVTRSHTLVTTITDPAATSFTDTGIAPDTTYYYRVFTVNDLDIATGSKEENGLTLPPYSYSWDFEDGPGQWQLDDPWYVTDENAHDGNRCLSDSPGSYENSASTSAQIRVNLSTFAMPRMDFWHWYAFQANYDYGYVEVSFDNGVAWHKISFVTGDNGGWTQEEVDLARYAGLSDVLIRFRVVSNADTPSDGWYIDDITITDASDRVLPFPFVDDLDEGSSNWVTGSWAVVNQGPNSESCLTDSPVGNYLKSTNTRMYLAMAGYIDLSEAKNPVLSFQNRRTFISRSCRYEDEVDQGRVYISTGYGQEGTWDLVSNFSNANFWAENVVDISKYAGLSKVRLIFSIADDYCRDYDGYFYLQNNGWFINNVAVLDAPVNVTLNEPANIAEHAMDLSWSKNQDDDFVQYKIYRSTASGVTQASTLVTTITDPETIYYQDADLPLPDTTYYYKVFVLDSEGLYNQGSNEVSGTTLDGRVDGSFPFNDDMEDGDKWSHDLPWSLTSEDVHSGDWAWTDSPGTTYANNQDISMTTTIDLSGSVRPLLSFWHKYDLERNGDFGYVRVSNDMGASWRNLHVITGSSNSEWVRAEIDLSYWAGQEIQLQFQMQSNASVVADGWYIDDIAITENTAVASLPFFDDMENGTGNWILSNWGLDTTYFHSRSHGLSESPDNHQLDYCNPWLVNRGVIDLTETTNPHLIFQTSFCIGHSTASVWISTDGGHTYTDTSLWSVSATSADWHQVDLDLSPYKDSDQVVVLFSFSDSYSGSNFWGWAIDDVYIGESCPAEALTVIPDNASLLPGETLQFTALDQDENELFYTPEWFVKGDMGTIDENGLFTASQTGIGAVRAGLCNGEVQGLSRIIEVTGPAGGVSQVEQGRLFTHMNAYPENGCVAFNAFIASRPDEILTQDSPGCAYEDGVWQVNPGNFPTAWAPGDILILDVVDTCLGETGQLKTELASGGRNTDLTLSPISFDLKTTATTSVNPITLVKDSGLATAEDLVQDIPHALEVAYWDAGRQAYVAHTKGSPLVNFDVTPGHPYLVTVTDDGTWTPTGSVPDPWPSFDLATTGQTNVNMVSAPLSMLRITRAEELGHFIPGCTEIAQWDVESQGYLSHTYGTPLLDFDLSPGHPYFVTVTRSGIFALAKAALSATSAAGITQNETGRVYNMDMSIPANENLQFRAWIQGREYEILTQDSVGCGYLDGYWQVNVGNFPTAWNGGDVLEIDFRDTGKNQEYLARITLEYGGQQTDIFLSPPPCEWDTDLDRDVDEADLAEFVEWFGISESGGTCPGDFEADNDADGSDLFSLIQDLFRTDCP